MKIIFIKGFQIYATHMEETMKDKDPILEGYPVLRDFEDMFEEFLGFPLKKDIDLSIHLIPEAYPISNTPYKMSTPEIKQLQMQLEELLNKRYIIPSVSHWGAPVRFVKKK
jgi:hypothetical protein